MLVRIDEHAVGAAEPLPERVELLAQLRVTVRPRVARHASLAGSRFAAGLPVAERGRDDGARVLEQQLRVTRHLRLRHGEPHVREEPAGAPLADVPLGLGVRLSARGADDVEAELLGELLQATDPDHAYIVPGIRPTPWGVHERP